jgi:hypothetical protein
MKFKKENAVRYSVSIVDEWMRFCYRGMKRLVPAFLLAGFLQASLPALAQAGQVTGSVRDPHDALVAGAKVALTNLV